MVIRSVTIDHVRCHVHSRIECDSDLMIITGPNGWGKTSILESISLCSMGRTFVPVPDISLVQHGADGCHVRVEAMSDNDVPYVVEVTVRPGQRKVISTNQGEGLSSRELIGRMPVVALSPDLKAITFGGPAERRSFIDAIMAQSNAATKDLLFEHRRILKQRNSVLQSDRVDTAMLETWTEKFIEVSTTLIERRRTFINDLAPMVREEYQTVSGGREQVDIQYLPDSVDPLSEGVSGELRKAAQQVAGGERMRRITLFGPQKDEVLFQINGGNVRETASQGQHKTFLIALKLAECRILNERCKERPVVLLDDVFSELDSERSALVLERISAMGMQCFVTKTGEREAA
jgi:DNA replication and repair protein RecF